MSVKQGGDGDDVMSVKQGGDGDDVSFPLESLSC